jgi:phosphoglycolate phosphatase-like HAD superfamily hydrolase
MIIFDMDGVLINSKDIIIQAYEDAGVVAPDDPLSQEGTRWLEDLIGASSVKEVRRNKDKAYLRLLLQENVQFLPPFHAALKLYENEEIRHELGIFTGAPIGTVLKVIERATDEGLPWPFTFYTEKITTSERMRTLDTIDSLGVYIDDQDRLVHVPSGWSFIKYDDQSAETLYEEVKICL